MSYKIAYWSNEQKRMLERYATDEEIAQIELDKANAQKESNIAFNADIISQLEVIDAKSIRALREGNTVRIQALEAEAVQLRSQLIKE